MKRPNTLDFNELIQHPGKHDLFEIATKLSTFEDISLHGLAKGTLDAYSTGNALIVKGEIKAQIWVECSRCALRFAEPVAFTAEDEFQIEGVPAVHSHHSYAHVTQEEEPFPLFDGNNLLIDEFVHQHLVINLPLQDLCREDCKGLCSQCGQNLNEGDCSCSPVKGHQAFAELADIWQKHH